MRYNFKFVLNQVQVQFCIGFVLDEVKFGV
jgi:hypothetical protein